jgi:pyruvate dehydrogenase E1 component alpha subunit
MVRARALEEALAVLWREGRVSGEMHLGMGEEGVAAGVAAHLRAGDAVALDHRGTPVLTALGVDPVLLLKEMLGREDGLNRGRAGHMHLMSPEHLAACSGIVGSSAPMGAGFALAARALRPGSVAVAFFGDGAMNQGMLLETLNLAAAWSLPLLLVCKDNDWAITTRSSSVTAGDLSQRAAAFGLPVADVDGLEVEEVHRAAGEAVERARRGNGPSFLRARVSRLEGHFLGDLMVRTGRHPLGEGREVLTGVVSSALASGGAGLGARAAGVLRLVDLLRRARADRRDTRDDPLERARRRLGREVVEAAEREAHAELARAVEAAMEGVG